MPVAGRKPKDGPKRNRMPAAHDWVEVIDKPFTGKCPVTLPRTRVADDGSTVRLLPLTLKWWKSTASMPHCINWRLSDWIFALEAALIADIAFGGKVSAFAELRLREKMIGTTADSRRDLRIRYVKDATTAKPVGGNVVELDPRRNRLLSDAP